MPDQYDNKLEDEFQLPECWKNDVRMGALFAPFRSKAINPTDWNSKMKFWTGLIESWCKSMKCPVLNVSSLKENFSRKGTMPACLEEVVQNLSSTGTLVLKENFVTTSETWKGWAVKVLVTNPVKWTFNTVKSIIIGKNVQSDLEYIHIPVLKFLGERLLKLIPSSSKGKLLTFDDLFILLNTKEDKEHLMLVLEYLAKEGSVSICNKNEEILVKFSKSSGKPVKISEIDLGLSNLEKQQKVLANNIKNLEVEKNEALEEAKKHLADKMKSLAKISLRRKKELERTIEMRATALENIQAILHKIDQAKLDSEVVECYQTGIKTLRGIFKETGLNEKNVTGTMEELEDVLNSHNFVEEALSKPLDLSADNDLEDELNELLLEDLPEVPKEKLPLPQSEKNNKNKKETEELKNKMEALSI
ncbi:hypothetical protein RUM43_007985 [Polyplax serrata]|uniref:Charged multivesicular body protein 7 n=1 Tax=Polyplax serrata TaxID=468196 RepID=A0AAN8P9V3_POLSC